MKLFVFGLGYSATNAVNRLGAHCLESGGWVAATTRSTQKADEIKQAGLHAHLFDGEKPGDDKMREQLKQATHLLISISPGEDDPVLLHHYDDIVASQSLQWIGYYSTVGVYGDYNGEWVSEDSACRPVSKRSRQRVGAERAWTLVGNEKGVPVALIRLAGIYGPGRNAFVNLDKGTARRIIKPGQVFNRIHVDDIGAITEQIALARSGGVFNAADNEPAPPQDVVEYAAKLMDVPVPPGIPFDEAELSPMGRSFYSETKRISNKRLADEFDYDFLFPTYRDTLDQLWREGTWNTKPQLKDFNP